MVLGRDWRWPATRGALLSLITRICFFLHANYLFFLLFASAAFFEFLLTTAITIAWF